MVKYIKSLFARATAPAAPAPDVHDVMITALGELGEYRTDTYNGNKFPGGFGYEYDVATDYWSLRQKSNQLFKSNHYFKGVIARLITNEITTGLELEAIPEEKILGLEEDALADWSEDIENRYSLWSQDKNLCDVTGRRTMAAIQRAARTEALIAGDVLVILKVSAAGLPMVQLVRGERVASPVGNKKLPKGHRIVEGVQLNARDRQVAYWIQNDDGTFKQIPAFGHRGRANAWLLYGDADTRVGEVRGMPLLSRVLQSLKEIDRYRDSAQRKATINSSLAMFIKKTQDKMSTLPVSGGAVRKDSATIADADGGTRTYNMAAQLPGVVMEELQVGEEPVGFGSQGTDINFAAFEDSMLNSIAWALSIPPEILKLSFTDNYSASQAAINEFKIYLDRSRSETSANFCKPIYNDWLIASTLMRQIEAPGLLEAYRNPSQYLIFGAWVKSDWTGAIKPSTDLKKTAQGAEILVTNGWATNSRVTRELTGTKFSKNMQILKRENELKAEAMRPLLELKKEFGEQETNAAEQEIIKNG